MIINAQIYLYRRTPVFYCLMEFLLAAVTRGAGLKGLSSLCVSVDFITCNVDFFLSLVVQFLGVGLDI